MSKYKRCSECWTVFEKDRRYSATYWSKQKYCSQDCAGQANSRHLAAERLAIDHAFSLHVSKGDGCWEWTGLKDKDGYGLFPYAGKQRRANRVALEIDGRPAPKGMYACHTCDNPGCVRPSHLYPGTATQNMADAASRGRVCRGERRSRLTEADVLKIRAATDTHERIAATFGVSRAAISLIRERKTWRHVI